MGPALTKEPSHLSPGYELLRSWGRTGFLCPWGISSEVDICWFGDYLLAATFRVDYLEKGSELFLICSEGDSQAQTPLYYTVS